MLLVGPRTTPVFTVLDKQEEEESDHAIAMDNVIGNKFADDELVQAESTLLDDKRINGEIFLAEQGRDVDFEAVAQTVGIPNSDFSYNQEGYLIRRSRVDGAVE